MALVAGKTCIARRERQPVGVADGGEDADLHVEIQVEDDATDDDRLLRVLLAEVRTLGAHDVEELHAHGRDTAEMPAPRIALRAGK